MKGTIILIATVFLIGISVSDAVKKPGEAAGKEKTNSAQKGGKKGTKAADDNVSAGDSKNKDDADEEDEDSEAEEEEEEEKPAKEEVEEEEKPRRKKPVDRKKSAKAARKVQADDDEEDDEVEVVRPKKKTKKKPTISDLNDLKDQAASMNPANLIAALQKTPAEELEKVLPQLKKLTNMLDGTPMGPIFENLTSLLGNSSPQNWTSVLKLFPNFAATIIGNGTKLMAVGAKAIGGTAKSAVEVADLLFNTGKDLLSHVTALPGGNLLTPLGQVLDVVHGTLVDPLDSVADEIKATGKRQIKRMERSASRSRGGLFGSGGLLGFGSR